jgi:hypothetical protein
VPSRVAGLRKRIAIAQSRRRITEVIADIGITPE